MKWFRLYSEVVHDIKLRRFSVQEKWAWVVLLCLANESSNRGTITASDEDIADYCEFRDLQDWLYFKDKLRQKGMIEPIEGGIAIANWDNRQFDKPSDRTESTRERKRKSRAKKKAEQVPSSRDVTPSSRDVTRCHATYTDTDTELDPDPDLSPPTPSPERESERASESDWDAIEHELAASGKIWQPDADCTSAAETLPTDAAQPARDFLPTRKAPDEGHIPPPAPPTAPPPVEKSPDDPRYSASARCNASFKTRTELAQNPRDWNLGGSPQLSSAYPADFCEWVGNQRKDRAISDPTDAGFFALRAAYNRGDLAWIDRKWEQFEAQRAGPDGQDDLMAFAAELDRQRTQP